MKTTSRTSPKFRTRNMPHTPCLRKNCANFFWQNFVKFHQFWWFLAER